MKTYTCAKCGAETEWEQPHDCPSKRTAKGPSDATDCSALAAKWGKQADMLLAQKKDFKDRGYSSSLIQLWDTVSGVLNDCKTELEEAISSQNSVHNHPPLTMKTEPDAR